MPFCRLPGDGDLAARMANDPEFVRQAEDGWQAIEAGRCAPLDEVKRRLGDAQGWDKPKVDHWLGRVGGHIRLARTVSLLISGDALPRSAPGQDLLDEWLCFSLWEQVYALYGLRDLVAAELTADIHHWQNLARTDDDARSK